MFADPLEEGDRGDVFFVGGACKTGLLTSGTCGANVEVFSFSEVLRGGKRLAEIAFERMLAALYFPLIESSPFFIIKNILNITV